MRPWLFHIGGIGVPSYWVFLMIGFIAAIYLSWREARRDGLVPEHMLDLALVVLVAGLIGARLMHVLAEENPLKPGTPILYHYLEHPSEIFNLSSGFAFYGGLLLAGLAALSYAKWKNMDVAKVADIAGLCIPLGLFFGRLGCFLAGCCHGGPTDLPLSVTFSDHQSLARPLNVPLHPTQLYSAGFALVLFALMWITKRRFLRFKGQAFLVFIILYSAGRFGLEFMRNDNRGMFFGRFLSASQVVAVPLLIGAIVVLVVMNRRARAREAGSL